VIDCPNCKIRFSPQFRYCPRCNAHQTPFEERRSYLKRRSEELVMEGLSATDLRQMLISEGLADFDADTIVRDSTSKVRSTNRSFGCSRLVLGITMLTAGTLMLITVLFVTRNIGGVILAKRSVVAFAFAAGLLVLSGIYAIFSGLRSTITGS
jgi:hypothetical protein